MNDDDLEKMRRRFVSLAIRYLLKKEGAVSTEALVACSLAMLAHVVLSYSGAASDFKAYVGDLQTGTLVGRDARDGQLVVVPNSLLLHSSGYPMPSRVSNSTVGGSGAH